MRSPDAELMTAPPGIRLGLRANWEQFTLLVIVNAFVGGMVGLERTVVPLIAEADFGLASATLALSFIAAFGLVKALSNLAAGRFSDRVGRKQVLVLGWLAGLPVPFLIIYAPSWSWIVGANVLLGINQGLCWSTTVIMKIDLAGPKQRGLAMGLNEAAGYLAVAGAAFASGWIASSYGLRPEPFYLGIVFAVAGLVLSTFAVRESRPFAELESRELRSHAEAKRYRPFREVFALTSWRNRSLFATCQAGLVNNLNDGVAWGLFPIFFAAAGLSLHRIAVLAAIYPAVWGLGQIGAGALSDTVGRKRLIVAGMWLQGASIIGVALSGTFPRWLAATVFLGLGTAMVYPTLLAAIGDVAHPSWRASAIGVYRLWRDLGYVVGALAAGYLANRLGMSWAIGLTGLLTIGSGAVVAATPFDPR
ncbi:MAG TPA: MFS transporter [Thermomicrobiales bacterium]|nr:MFS transporter [Thermomicrobiales bacterium]